MELQYKKCKSEDAPVLAKLGRTTFIDAFEHLNNPEDFYSYVDMAFSEEQIKKEIHTAGSRFYLVYNKDSLVGYVKLNSGSAQTEPMDNNCIELERIYVSSEFQNKGLGLEILNHFISQSKSEGFSSIWLGVWQENPGAIRFYQRHGFKIFGTHPYYIGEDKQTDWLMKLDLI